MVSRGGRKGKTTGVPKRSGAGGEEYGTLNSDEVVSRGGRKGKTTCVPKRSGEEYGTLNSDERVSRGDVKARSRPPVSLREMEQVERNIAPSIVMRGSVEVDGPPVSPREVEQVERNITLSIVRGSAEVDVWARPPISLGEVSYS